MDKKLNIFYDFCRFAENLIKYGDSLCNKIEGIGRINTPDNIKDIIRKKKLLYYRESIRFFNNRSKFIIMCVKDDDKSSYLDILRTLLRGLIEIYCKVIYVSKADKHICAPIWNELKLYGYLYMFKNKSLLSKGKEIEISLSWNYKVLRHFTKQDFKIEEIAKYLKERYKTCKRSKKIQEIEKNYSFLTYSTIPNIIIKHHDENDEPKFPKSELYRFYSVFSEQIHANLYREGYILGTEKYQLLTFMVIMYLRFLKVILDNLDLDKSEINEKIKEFKSKVPQYVDLWKFNRLLLRR